MLLPAVFTDLGATTVLAIVLNPAVLTDLGTTTVVAFALSQAVLAYLGATTVFASAFLSMMLAYLGSTTVSAFLLSPIMLTYLGATTAFAMAFSPVVLTVSCQFDTSGAGVGGTEPSGPASFVRLRRPDPRSARHQNKTVLTRRFPSLFVRKNKVQSPPFHLERITPSTENLCLWYILCHPL